MNPRTLLLFDIDGTLLSCRGRGIRAMQAAVERIFGLAPVPVQLEPHGKTDPMLFDELALAYALPAERLSANLPALHAVYATELEILLREPGACAAQPGAGDLLSALSRRSDVALGVVSGNLERTAWLKLEAVSMSKHFVIGAFGSDARLRADLVTLALERCGVRFGVRFAPERVWVIGDTPDDVASGLAHGMRTLAVATGRHARDGLLACGAHVALDDFSDTARVVDILCRLD